MTDSIKPLTAKAKLASSRAELLAAMGFERLESGGTNETDVVQRAKFPPARPTFSNRVSQSVIGSWWRRSHLSSAFELAEPFLQDYARRHPARLIAYGAGTGAVLWIIKPWRLLSVATVVGLAMKSSNITGMVVDMVGRMREPGAGSAARSPVDALSAE
ncbi:MAG: hypothetical protein RET84_17720 [Pseudomonadota bacterium]|nr:hypothetical protein [Pseudomonadota bacterium]